MLTLSMHACVADGAAVNAALRGFRVLSSAKERAVAAGAALVVGSSPGAALTAEAEATLGEHSVRSGAPER